MMLGIEEVVESMACSRYSFFSKIYFIKIYPYFYKGFGVTKERNLNIQGKEHDVLDGKCHTKNYMIAEIKGVKKKYNKEKFILKDIDMEIKEGEVIGIVGLNGAGKSTLMKMMAGVSNITEGDILYQGKSVSSLSSSQRKEIVYFSTNNNIYGDLTTLENLEFYKRLYKTDNIHMNNVIRNLNLEEILNKAVNTLSSGQKKIVAIACNTMSDAKLVLLDEPTITLDIDIKKKVIHYFKGICRKDNAVLITSHNIKDIEELCQKVYIIKNGTIIQSGEVDKIYTMAMNQNKKFLIKIKNEGGNEIDTLLENYIFYEEGENICITVEEDKKKELFKRLVENDADIIEQRSLVGDLEDAIIELIKEGEHNGGSI